MQELFDGLYFPQDQDEGNFARALPRTGHPLLARMAKLAAELEVVLPISFFEKAGQVLQLRLSQTQFDRRNQLCLR